MIKTILLLLPVYISFFWFIALIINFQNQNSPRKFLWKFMILLFVIYSSHFLYFKNFPGVYIYFDALLQYASLLMFPLFYIYFRLLTVDKKFSVKVHAPYLVIPTVLFILYVAGVLFTPTLMYKTWLYDMSAFPESASIIYLNYMHIAIRITYLIQIVIIVIAVNNLTIKHGNQADQFYTDSLIGRFNYLDLLKYAVFAFGFSMFIFRAYGRIYFSSSNSLIYLGWIISSIMLFIIGWLGITDKPKKAVLIYDLNYHNQIFAERELIEGQKIILKKLLHEFDENKIYLNCQLNIMDVVQAVGTNRTYISVIINQQFNQNFCSFVNGYRIAELEKVFSQHPEYPNEILAEYSGFGSLNSLKRTISSKSGKSISEWKNSLSQEKIEAIRIL